MHLDIERLKYNAVRSWKNLSPEYRRCGTSYSTKEQVQREAEVQRLTTETDATIKAMNGGSFNPKRKLLSVRSRIQKSVVQLLHCFDCVIDNETEQCFSSVIDDFIREAYDFDPLISEEAVYQASRNVLIMNTFQLHLGKAVKLTPSVFAYSLLYPYTDNYLDATSISSEVKRDFNDRLGQRLLGICLTPRNRHERVVDTLVEMIEQEFHRRQYPLVYESLLAIHRGQQRSLEQQDSSAKYTEPLLLKTSVEKGGASVVADGYLVAGMLTQEDEEFIFNFGVVLQLIDDLQDIEEDLRHRHHTLAGAATELRMLDVFTNRLLAYLDNVLCAPHSEKEKARALMERGCRLLILEAIAFNSSYYSEEYLRRNEMYSPVRFEFLKAMNRKLRERNDGYRQERERECDVAKRCTKSNVRTYGIA
jgi:hypothetical protein